MTPHLRIVSGNPTPEEIAIVTAVMSTAGGGEQQTSAARSLWARPSMRTPISPSNGAWRASGLPKQ